MELANVASSVFHGAALASGAVVSMQLCVAFYRLRGASQV